MRKDAPPLEIVPLGGLGEFGLNMMALACGGAMVVIDVGLMFPDRELLGVDLVIPDMTYLAQNKDRIAAVLLTHGHEDHVGALPYLLNQVRVPVYGTPLTLGLCRNRLHEHQLLARTELQTVTPGTRRAIGPFNVDFIRVTHSLADAVALAIDTPQGTIIHTGDFKLDQNPVVGEPIDLHRLAYYGQRNVLALLSDSTNSERHGHTGSERDVEEAFEDVISRTEARVFVSCFTSSTHRVQLTLDLAAKYRRKVVLLGRSMSENVQTALDLGYLTMAEDLLVRPSEVHSLPRHKVLALVAGSQGEPLSALSQIAVGNHKYVAIEPGDHVIVSARVIPGNERAVSRVINHLYRRDAHIVHSAIAQVHVSGHASADELKLMLNLIRPKYFIPIHGEWRQLVTHARIARQLGIPADHVLLAEDGDLVSFEDGRGRIAGKVHAGRVIVDGSELGDVEDIVLRDRKHLSAGGIVIPVVVINSRTAKMETPPDIITRGFLTGEDGEQLLSEARDVVKATLEGASGGEADWGLVKDKIQSELRRFFRKRTRRRPMILPVVMEI